MKRKNNSTRKNTRKTKPRSTQTVVKTTVDRKRTRNRPKNRKRKNKSTAGRGRYWNVPNPGYSNSSASSSNNDDAPGRDKYDYMQLISDRKTKLSYLINDYYCCVMTPDKCRATVPTFDVFPRSLVTIKTTLEINTGVASGDLTFSFGPQMFDLGIWNYNGTPTTLPTVTIDTAAVLPNTGFSCHHWLSDWAGITDDIRVVGMRAHLEYDGNVLSVQGKVSHCSYPPLPTGANLPGTFTELNDYVYSKASPLKDGAWQILVPNSNQVYFTRDGGGDFDPFDYSTMMFAINGQPDNQPLLLTVWQVVEIYSQSQVLSNLVPRVANSSKLDMAHNALAQTVMSNNTGGTLANVEEAEEQIEGLVTSLARQVGPDLIDTFVPAAFQDLAGSVTKALFGF